ncbi:sorting nexin lst-4 isoform X2 [Lingula anatina]|uniref:Sorting nexin n=1 Tax=Lingula anatina TaxID=7574 RepID=A0A1S3H3H5_LINAN|nr:sorting nexin lst-4 isoform X2 [Lingula anatina]|eukprot:XP_013380502.1 sorting nexin lst-4 isoform X2 [Lingula anatina]
MFFIDPLIARGLYDFQGEAVNGEISFSAGDVLTILRQDIGEGWWEARNSHGEQGLIPEAYVEIEVDSVPEPNIPLPPPPPGFEQDNALQYTTDAPRQSMHHIPYQDTGQQHNYQQQQHQQQQQYQQQQYQQQQQQYHQQQQQQQQQYHDYNQDRSNIPQTQESFDDWDDDWDDDDDASSTTTEQTGGQADAGSSRINRQSADPSKFGTVKKGFNRFSTFVKTGGEAFMLGTTSVARVPENEMVKIIETSEGFMWEPNPHPFTCNVASPKKESKFKGMKSFIAYQITPTFSGIQVSRRYKQFDWLHKRLEIKFPCIVVPPLPDKQVTGRFEEEFIQERMRQLQEWIDRLVKHPVVSRSETFIHFLTTTDEKQWKQGKRKAEKDEFQGGKFMLTIQVPPQPLDATDTEAKIDEFGKFTKNMEDGCRHLMHVFQDNARKHQGPFKREFQKIGNSITNLASSFEMADESYSAPLTDAIKYTGKTYDEIGGLFEQQPKFDSYSVIETLHEYKGILQAFPEVLTTHKAAMTKVRECQKSQEEGKMSESDYQAVVQRGDIVSYSVLAEINHFQHERAVDYKMMFQNYLKAQIEFHKKITTKLEEALNRYNSV